MLVCMLNWARHVRELVRLSRYVMSYRFEDGECCAGRI